MMWVRFCAGVVVDSARPDRCHALGPADLLPAPAHRLRARRCCGGVHQNNQEKGEPPPHAGMHAHGPVADMLCEYKACSVRTRQVLWGDLKCVTSLKFCLYAAGNC